MCKRKLTGAIKINYVHKLLYSYDLNTLDYHLTLVHISTEQMTSLIPRT